uniref:NADH-ubiquinone oxidoreductase chain 2 n=1 Tax=Sphyrocoris obliquus TaxID=2080407 RepID=A0A2K9YVH9_9HEMI|nr:NADH dehydrogenase subunit 2 [Sphyrocoris obliquus]
MLKSKSLFFVIMIAGTILTLSSNSWISMWMGLEINMMAFIPLMKNNDKSTPQAMMIYLLTQSISSMILMFSIVMKNLTLNEMFESLILISLLIKMGAAPFHMWLPEIVTKMSWGSTFTLLTWQKLAPLSMLNNMSFNNKVMYGTILTSIIVGSIGGLNQMSMRKIMAYSSINHMGWMMSLSKVKSNWMSYIVIYSAMVSMLCLMFYKYNMIHINQINSLNMSNTEKVNYFIAMMSLGGLPPFLGFLPKWMVIQTFTESEMYMMMMIMVMFSLLSLYYYMRTMTGMMMSNSMNTKWLMIKSDMLTVVIMLMLNMSLPLVMIVNMT